MSCGELGKGAKTEHTPEVMYDEIWLQCPNRDSMSEWYGEVTWAEEKINDDDTKYVRADIAESLKKQRDELLAKVAAWEQKAANWMASPEAAQRLDGYRDLAQRLNISEQQRDELLVTLEKLTDVFANIGITSGLYDDEQDALKAACDVIASMKGGE